MLLCSCPTNHINFKRFVSRTTCAYCLENGQYYAVTQDENTRKKPGSNTQIYEPRSEYGLLRTARRPISMQDFSTLYDKRLYFLKQLKRAKAPCKKLAIFYTSCNRSVIDYAIPVFYHELPKYLQNDLKLFWSNKL